MTRMLCRQNVNKPGRITYQGIIKKTTRRQKFTYVVIFRLIHSTPYGEL